MGDENGVNQDRLADFGDWEDVKMFKQVHEYGDSRRYGRSDEPDLTAIPNKIYGDF